MKTRLDSLSEFKSLNQPILNLSSSFSRSSLIPLSEEIHKTLYFSRDKGTSSSLGISDLLVSENLENKRIVSKSFISKNTEDKSISSYKLVVQVPRIINHYLRSTLVDLQLTIAFDNLSTIQSKRRTLGWKPDGLTNYYHHLTTTCLKACKIHAYSQILIAKTMVNYLLRQLKDWWKTPSTNS